MRETRFWIAMGCCLFSVALFARAQTVRKPGLWEMTSNMTWQQTPLPPGMSFPAGMKSPFSGTTTTTQICLTQAMIDKYGTAMPRNQSGCRIANLAVKADAMTADMVCSGGLNGKGTIAASWSDSDHTKGRMHFVGDMQGGQNPMPVEWTIEFASVYKASDCGDVKPLSISNN
jgi:hypothetical protein